MNISKDKGIPLIHPTFFSENDPNNPKRKEYINEQCRKCFHFQVCAQVMKNTLFIREKMLKEANPKCEHFISSADIEKVRYGKWDYEDSDVDWTDYSCSVCRNIITTSDIENELYNYCPYCGARMKKT